MKAATAAFKTALRLNPRDLDANLDLGTIRLQEKDFTSARALLELALELQPKVPLGRLEMAKLDQATGKYTDAVEVLEALVKDEPNWSDAHWYLATAYFELNCPEDGRRQRVIAEELKTRQQAELPDAK